MKKPSKLALIISILFPIASQALDSDHTQPMYLMADTAQLNQQTNAGIYQGNVRLDQGTTHLTADYATTLTDQDNTLITATAQGNDHERAHYWTLTDPDKPELHARAERIEYQAAENKIYLIGNAEVIQGEDSYFAPLIEYDTVADEVISPPHEEGRTVIIYQNKTDNN